MENSKVSSRIIFELIISKDCELLTFLDFIKLFYILIFKIKLFFQDYIVIVLLLIVYNIITFK